MSWVTQHAIGLFDSEQERGSANPAHLRERAFEAERHKQQKAGAGEQGAGDCGIVEVLALYKLCEWKENRRRPWKQKQQEHNEEPVEELNGAKGFGDWPREKREDELDGEERSRCIES